VVHPGFRKTAAHIVDGKLPYSRLVEIKMKMMKNRIPLLFSAIFLPLLTGCSTGHDYWGNRWEDVKDIFSLTAGAGFGVKVQVGPIQVDSGYNYVSLWGLRHGEILPVNVKHGKNYHISEGNIGVFLPFCNAEIFYPGKHSADRGKAYCAMTPMLPFFLLEPDKHSSLVCNECAWKRKFARSRAEREKYRKLPPEEQKKIKADRVPLTEEETKHAYGSSYGTNRAAFFRHNSRTSTAFLDGHTSLLEKSVVPCLESYPGINEDELKNDLFNGGKL